MKYTPGKQQWQYVGLRGRDALSDPSLPPILLHTWHHNNPNVYKGEGGAASWHQAWPQDFWPGADLTELAAHIKRRTTGD